MEILAHPPMVRIFEPLHRSFPHSPTLPTPAFDLVVTLALTVTVAAAAAIAARRHHRLEFAVIAALPSSPPCPRIRVTADENYNPFPITHCHEMTLQ